MKKIIIAILVVAAAGAGYWYFGSLKVAENDKVKVEFPRINEKVSSPLLVTGQARGSWFFEASFPITLKDDNGNIVAQGYAMTADDWMTTNFVSFESIPLTFERTPTTKKGVLILHKDNPSGLPEHDEELRIPVRF